ncbi:MCE family protein [Nocardioides anomalus]|uniref:MCE family protein n=1 Tax=Nocardioides anomalus TaxID=2712223 RepID=A0A6G6WCM3_9ACTN|nr:MlaD family protein [Nocardioides anomalus]QIG42969.1 MCE family protein [Nocardioides anomalus]
MTRGTRIRIAAFLVLSAVGIVYITASYLGFVDKVLGRGLTVQATLPTSGGLYVGSEVTYRGVKIGKVSHMSATAKGVTLGLALEDGTRLPKDSPMYVHNLSAVGEQYLDFEPPDDRGPYAAAGDVLHGDADSLPVDEGDLLVELNAFVDSVDKKDLQVVVRELGTMFHDTGRPLQTLLDSGSTFIDEASAHTAETRALLDDGLTVLQTQQGQSENIRAFSRDLAKITKTLAASDQDLRTTLSDTPGTAREVDQLLTQLEPTLPVLLANTASVNQTVMMHLAGVEQLLVVFPHVISSGFTGTPGDGYGHVNLQLDQRVQPCTQGYEPPSEWRPPSDYSDAPIYPAQCTAGPPFVQRGTPYSPEGRYGNPGAAYRSGYDPTSGIISGVVDQSGNPVRLGSTGNLSVLGDDAWKWLLVGPVAAAP